MGTPSTTRAVDIDVQAATDITMVKSLLTNKRALYVDGTNGAATNDGLTWETAFSTITLAVAAAAKNDVIFIAPKEVAITDLDPSSYAETVIISTPGLALIGVSRGRTQGGMPQIKKGSGTTALITVRAPGCLIKNLGFNGIWTADSTQSLVGILLDDDGSTKTAWGTTIEGCHFKNCAGSTASTNAEAGGAITWASTGGPWQVLIKGCRFYKNVGDIVVPDSLETIPQDVIIEDCVMSGPAANVDCNIYVGTGGVNGIIVKNCIFGQLPALGGTNDRYIKMASGTVGMIVANYFGCATNVSGTPKTFKSGGSGADFPTTVHCVGNFGQSVTAAEAYGAIITIA